MDINFPKIEERILDFWKKDKVFEKSISQFFSPLDKSQQKELSSLLRKLIHVSWAH